jgi:hypothetical protein
MMWKYTLVLPSHASNVLLPNKILSEAGHEAQMIRESVPVV